MNHYQSALLASLLLIIMNTSPMEVGELEIVSLDSSTKTPTVKSLPKFISLFDAFFNGSFKVENEYIKYPDFERTDITHRMKLHTARGLLTQSTVPGNTGDQVSFNIFQETIFKNYIIQEMEITASDKLTIQTKRLTDFLGIILPVDETNSLQALSKSRDSLTEYYEKMLGGSISNVTNEKIIEYIKEFHQRRFALFDALQAKDSNAIQEASGKQLLLEPRTLSEYIVKETETYLKKIESPVFSLLEDSSFEYEADYKHDSDKEPIFVDEDGFEYYDF